MTRARPTLLRLYLGVTALAPGLLRAQARGAHRRMGAEAGRLKERLGQPTLPRPRGGLVWLHAASVGEVTSAARLAQALADRPGTTLLVTTTTATGAATVARLIPQARHQFLPVDTPSAVAGFLDHWRPDVALFVEGDLWPRLILALADRGVPLALLNARASRSRRRAPAVYGALLAPMRLVTLQDPALRPELLALGVRPQHLHAPGNLKADLAPLAVDDGLVARLRKAAGGRGCWAAVSTHAGEEEAVLAAQGQLSGAPLLILAPRHPERAEEIAAQLARRGLAFTRHSRGDQPDAGTAVHLVDALGLLGSVYAAAGLAFVGGSLGPGIGGHTPHEPAALGTAILTGPHVANFSPDYAALIAAGGAVEVADAAALAREVAALLADPGALATRQAAARACHAAQAGATEATLRLLAPLLP